MGRYSFLIQKQWGELIHDFSNEEAGQLFKAILKYQNEGIEPSGSQKSQWGPVFKVMKFQFTKDEKQYDKICERNQNNGSKHAKKGNPVGPKKASGGQKHPLGADYDNDINNTNVLLHPLQEWLKKECPRVCKLKEPITFEEAERITAEFKDKKSIEQLFYAMENKATLLKEYISANKTFRTWMSRNSSQGNKPNNSPSSHPGLA